LQLTGMRAADRYCLCTGAGETNRMLRTLLPVLLLAACTTAQAQEAKPVQWDTEAGRVVYTLEDGPLGVLDYPVPYGDNVGHFNIDGLAGEFGGPGPLEGWWSEPDVSHDD